MKKNLKVNTAKLLAGTMIVTGSLGCSTDLAKNLTSSVVASVGSILEPLEVYASQIEAEIDDDFVVKFDKSTGTIKWYTSGEGVLRIPDEIDGVTVRNIDSQVFDSQLRTSASKITEISLSGKIKSLGTKTFAYNNNLESVTFEEGFENTGAETFWGCDSLITVNLPSTLTTIGRATFFECLSLREIKIPSSVTVIETSAFARSSSLRDVEIGSNITAIGQYAFENCISLDNIYYAGSEEQWNAIFDNNEEQWYATSGEEAGIAEYTTIHFNSTMPSDDIDNTTNSTTISNDNSSLSFTDVSSSANYYEALKYLVDNGVINGTTDTTFSPNDVMTRATLVVMLYRMEGSPATVPVTFTDVPAGSWYASAIAWAKNLGLVNGTGDGSTFSPDDALTKEQVVAIIDRYYTSKSYNLDTTKSGTISDSSKTSSWALDSVNKMYQIGILNTDSSNNFNPTSSATRSDVAYMLGNLLLKVN